MTATNAPVSTEQDRPSHSHGHMHRGLQPLMHTDMCPVYLQSYTGKNTHREIIQGAHLRCSLMGNFSNRRAHTHTHPYTPKHPFLPIPDPSLPFPSSHLPGPIPSIKLPKQVSQQPRKGKVSVCPSPCPHPAWQGSTHTQFKAWDTYTSTAHDCTEMGHTKETRASSQPYT